MRSTKDPCSHQRSHQACSSQEGSSEKTKNFPGHAPGARRPATAPQSSEVQRGGRPMTPAEHYGAWSGRIGLWAPPSQLTHAALSTPATCRS